MNNNQYNKLKGKKPDAGTLSATLFALSNLEREYIRNRKLKTKGAFGKCKNITVLENPTFDIKNDHEQK